MPISPSTHPRFCDPRYCTTDREFVDHRQAPLVWQATAHEVELSVGLTRTDELGRCADIGDVHVALSLTDLVSSARTEVHGYLAPSDARMLAAALVCRAEQAEAEQRRRTAVAR